MNISHIACRKCRRKSFLETADFLCCPYCGSDQVDTLKTIHKHNIALSVMGFDKHSSEQQIAVLSTEGINYVEAGPGTAKSTTLVSRARFLIHYRQDGVHKPLILTFTNQAVDQLARAFLNERPQDRPYVATIHGFAYRTLHEYRIFLPDAFKEFRIMNEDDWMLFLSKYRADNPSVDKELSDAELKQNIQQLKCTSPYISNLFNGKWNDDPLLAPVLAYQHKNHLLDFDDLIHAFVWWMEKNPLIRGQISEKYIYVLVDEAQDLTDPELELLAMITERDRNLFLVGDSDQSIYGWRGARNRVSDWVETLGCKVHRFSLTQNYRSSQAILNAATGVIEAAPNRVHKTLKAVYPKGVRVMVKECPDPFYEARIIASSIELATDPHSQPLPLNYGDIAVLARSHASLRLIRNALIKKKIPVCIYNETPLFKTPAIQMVMRYLRFFADPNYWTLSALDDQLIPEHLWSDFWEEIKAANGSVSQALYSWYHRGKPLTDRGSWVVNLLNYTTRPMIYFKPKPLPLVLETLAASVENPETEHEVRAFRRLCRPLLKKTGNDLKVFLDILALAAQEETEYSEHRNLVHLLTLHGSKGRQFKKVFIAGVTASNIPNPKSDLEEERRLLYVGITRAMKELVVSYYRSSFGRAEEPSPFLAEMLKSPSVIFCPTEDYRKKRKPKKKI